MGNGNTDKKSRQLIYIIEHKISFHFGLEICKARDQITHES